jgi:capsular polysaccharide biosynthesis protein
VLSAAQRSPKLIALCALAGLVLGLAYVGLQLNTFAAGARVVLRDPWEADVATTDRPVGGDFERFVRSQARFVESDPVLSDAAASLATSTDELEKAVIVTTNSAGDVLVVTVQGGSAEEVERRLQAVLDAYANQRQSTVRAQVDNTLEGIEAELLAAEPGTRGELETRASRLRVAVAAYGDGIAFVEKDRPQRVIGLTGMVGYPLATTLAGLGGGLVLAWILADRRPRIDDPEALARRTGMAFLGTVPDGADLPPDDAPVRSAYEATILALANLLRSRDPRHGRRTYTVVMTSAAELPVTTAARQLARAATDNGARVRVVEADGQRRPGSVVDLHAETLASPDFDLLIFSCASPKVDFTALRLGMGADAIVLVVAKGSPAGPVDDVLQVYASVGQLPHGMVATIQNEEKRA